jgi:hypothetical protein
MLRETDCKDCVPKQKARVQFASAIAKVLKHQSCSASRTWARTLDESLTHSTKSMQHGTVVSKERQSLTQCAAPPILISYHIFCCCEFRVHSFGRFEYLSTCCFPSLFVVVGNKLVYCSEVHARFTPPVKTRSLKSPA